MPFKDCILKSYPEGNVTQWYGENVPLYTLHGLKGHNGIDLVAPHGTPLFAIEDGIVVSTKLDPKGYGKHVRILSDGREWTYGHLSKVMCSPGKKVKKGDVIGLMGNTGFVISGSAPFWEHNPYAGTHLHLGLRLYKEDSNGFSYEVGPKISILNYDNGVKGAVDPMPYLNALGTNPKSLSELYLTLVSVRNGLLAKLKK